MSELHVLVGATLLILMLFCPSGHAQNKKERIYLPVNLKDCSDTTSANTVLIVSTSEGSPDIESKIREYVKGLNVATFKAARILDDTSALRADLSKYRIITWGTPDGNLWNRKYIGLVPVEIGRNSIITNQEHNDTSLCFVSCWFNSQNPAKSWTIYTAQRPQLLLGLKPVMRGLTQFVVTRGGSRLQSGYYSFKNGKWEVSEVPDYNMPVLSKKQMYGDYDKFTKIVEQVFPLTRINKQIYGTDVPELLSKNRKEIASLNTTGDFVELLHNTMTLCRGSHFFIKCFGASDYYSGFVADDAYAFAETYETFLRLKNQVNLVSLPLLYFRGDYYTLHDMTRDGLTYPKGMKIIKCENQTPDSIIAGLRNNGIEMGWDYELKKDVEPQFYRYLKVPSEKPMVEFDFERTTGETIHINFNKETRVVYDEIPQQRKPSVTLLKNNILYIILPAMQPRYVTFYKDEIEKYKSAALNGVVVDIRDNGGGDDMVWKSLILMLVKGSLAGRSVLGTKNTELNKSYIARHSSGSEILKKGKIEKIEFLDNEKFLVMREVENVDVDSSALNYKGKIYVLSENIYSAAGTFMNICKYNDQLVSIGFPNNKILGFGIDPYAFSLPHSRIIFMIEPIVDLTDAKSAIETHHVDVEVRLEPTLQEMLDYYDYRNKVWTEEAMEKHDLFYKKVLELCQ